MLSPASSAARCLASTSCRYRRSVKNQLAVLFEQFGDFLQRLKVHVKGSCELFGQRPETLLDSLDDGGGRRFVLAVGFGFYRQEFLQRLNDPVTSTMIPGVDNCRCAWRGSSVMA